MNLFLMFTGIKGLGLSLALGAGLVGCAVLTVDVDVYKGALVNEEEVQLHQLVALATAAKPMLLQLRDILEWPNADGMPYAESKDNSNKYNSKECADGDKPVKDWYRAQYVSPTEGYIPEIEPLSALKKMGRWFTRLINGPQPSCKPHFVNPYARSVNMVLSLYEDVESPDLHPYGKKLRVAVEQLRRAYTIYELDKERDEGIIETISRGLKRNLSPELQALWRAYKEDLLAPPHEIRGKPIRRVNKLMSAFQALAQMDHVSKDQPKGKMESLLIDNWKQSQFDNDQEVQGQLYDQKLPSRAVWSLLSEGNGNTLFTWVTRQLCVDDPHGEEACKQLNKRTKELADAYWDIRQATREVWEESLDLLVRIERVERGEPDRYHSLKEKVIQLVTKTTDPSLIASALDRLNSNGTCSVLEDTLLREWKRLCDSDSKKLAWTIENEKKNSSHFKTILKQALSSAPSDTAHFLLTLDGLEKHADPKNSLATMLVNKVNSINPKWRVRLGLIVSYVAGTEEIGPGAVFQFVEEVSRDLANGFGRGRLSDGLHTLTEKYLQSHNGKRNDADSSQQKQLLESLVEFSQKILFLANHDGLASPPGSDGLIIGGSGSILRGLLGDEIMDGYEKNSLLGQSHVPKTMTRRYVRVLQAIGNSILFSANELRERERYREQGEKKVAAELTAAKSVHSPDPAKIIADLLAELEHEKQATEVALDEASTRKNKIVADIGSSTVPKTGLHEEKDKAESALAQTEQNLSNYHNSLSTLEAIHGILTDDVIKQIKSQWNAGQSAPNDVAEFLNGTDGLSLKKKLEIVRQSLNGTINPEEVKKWTVALQHIEAKETREAFEAYRTREGQLSLERSALFALFVTHIKSLDAERLKQVTRYESTHSEKQVALARIQQKILDLTQEVEDIEVKIKTTLPNDKNSFETAKQQIGSVKAAVLKTIDPDRQFISPKEVYARISSQLQKVNTADSKMAQTILASRMPPPGMQLLDLKDYKNPREVMDAVIALLRHHQMEVVERSGKGSKEEEKATEALENAYRHRSGMIYIRPSSAYLRTSFPSTSLQDDPNLAWDNMLLKQGLRNLPFSSELRDIFNPSVKQDQVLTSELDKQYWQNINRVRVSGTGRTNQALVKDDVGNWYVKQYFGDTERIWQSAKNLALFSMSAKIPIDLAQQLNKASSPEEQAENSKETPTLQKVLEKHQGAYTTHTKEIQAKLERLHNKELEEILIAAWDAQKELKDDAAFNADLKQALTAEIVMWKEMATTLKEDPGQAIVKDVGALSRLGRMLSARITKILFSDITQLEKELEGKQKKLAEQDKEKKKSDEDKLEAEKNKLKEKKEELEKKREMALFEVRKIVGGLVMDILTDRNRVLDHYEQAVVFIGDAANPKDSNSK